jgi:hypothetical protein
MVLIDELGKLTDNRAIDACSRMNKIVRDLLRELYADGMSPKDSRALMDVIYSDLHSQAAVERLRWQVILRKRGGDDTI